MPSAHIIFLTRALAEIERRRPKRSVTIARVICYLLRHRSTTVSDMSEALGHGRDSTLIQDCCADLLELGYAELTAAHPRTISLKIKRQRMNAGWMDAKRDDIVAAIDSSRTLTEVQRKFNVSRSTLQGIVNRLDIDVTKFKSNRTPPKKINHHRLLEMLARNTSVVDIAREFNVRPASIYQHLKKHNLRTPEA